MEEFLNKEYSLTYITIHKESGRLLETKVEELELYAHCRL